MSYVTDVRQLRDSLDNVTHLVDALESITTSIEVGGQQARATRERLGYLEVRIEALANEVTLRLLERRAVCKSSSRSLRRVS